MTRRWKKQCNPQEKLWISLENCGYKEGKFYELLNSKMISEFNDIRTEERFHAFLTYNWGEGRYAYGGAWEKTYIYNELGVFIGLFGGDYYDWQNAKKAVQFLKECVDKGYTSAEQLIDQHEQDSTSEYGRKYHVYCNLAVCLK